MRIAFLDPVPESAKIDAIGIELSKYAAEGVEVSYHCLEKGIDNFEYLTFEAFMIPEIMKKIKKLEGEGYDAAIIGCCLDPGLDAVKEFVDDIIVVGPGEAAMHLCSLLGKSFSIIIPKAKSLESTYELATKHVKSRFKSIKEVDISIRDLHMDLENETGLMEKAMIEKIEDAVNNDKAEVIVLGCTLEIGLFAKLQQRFDIPIIDPVIAGLKLAEYLIRCKNDCGWKTSAIGTYKRPDINRNSRTFFYPIRR